MLPCVICCPDTCKRVAGVRWPLGGAFSSAVPLLVSAGMWLPRWISSWRARGMQRWRLLKLIRLLLRSHEAAKGRQTYRCYATAPAGSCEHR
jgi:hypothetical protein